MSQLQRSPELQFGSGAADVRSNLSAVCASGDHLWLACDEGTCIERLTRIGPEQYERHARFDLSRFLALPVEDGEIDVEGLDVDAGCLWLVGSHSVKRNRPKGKGGPAKEIGRMAEIEADGNRYLLACIPLAHDESGDVAPCAKRGKLRAAQLPGDERGNTLLKALRDDDHVGPFAPRAVKIGGAKRVTGVPSKENGLDVEGLAVSGERVFVGLRGPVLRGWAIVLELRVEARAQGRLKLKRIGPEGERYRKHFLDLEGLGVRELAIDGADLLILAGPTMDLDGPVAVYRWTDALDAQDQSLVPRGALPRVLEVPYGAGAEAGRDHAEGISLLTQGGASGSELLVIYDSPAEARLIGDTAVRADVFALA